MPTTSIFLHKSIQDYADLIATVVDTSRSEIISDMIRYIKENVDEAKIWEGYNKKLEAFEDALEEESEESETGDLEESEENGDLEESEALDED